MVLRDAGSSTRTGDRTLLGARVSDGDRGPLVSPRCGRGLEHRHLDVVATAAHPLLKTPGAHQLHRSDAEDGRARERQSARPLLHEEHVDARPRHGRGSREPGGACPHDDDLMLVHCLGLSSDTVSI